MERGTVCIYLSEARSRPYQHLSLVAITHFAASFEIYKICTVLHRSKLSHTQKIVSIKNKYKHVQNDLHFKFRRNVFWHFIHFASILQQMINSVSISGNPWKIVCELQTNVTYSRSDSEISRCSYVCMVQRKWERETRCMVRFGPPLPLRLDLFQRNPDLSSRARAKKARSFGDPAGLRFQMPWQG